MFLFSLWVTCPGLVLAAPEFKIEIKNHLFFPSELTVPADTKVKLRIFNHDATNEEFESYDMNREKVIMGNSQTVIFIGPLKPGDYEFFGEFYPKTAQGKIHVE
ncbi:MAG: cupredoxin domain-containing protein [Gammaproteobacteria bacterium]|nr:cupredoxin domain-containing protein [Gammaproteobacteria bacterium]